MHDRHIGVLQEGVHTQHAIVGLDHGGGDLRARPDGEGDLGLFAVIDGKTLEDQASETGSGSATSGVEHHESLETGAIVRQLT